MVSDRGELYIESKEGILLNLLFLLVGREGIATILRNLEIFLGFLEKLPQF